MSILKVTESMTAPRVLRELGYAQADGLREEGWETTCNSASSQVPTTNVTETGV